MTVEVKLETNLAFFANHMGQHVVKVEAADQTVNSKCDNNTQLIFKIFENNKI